MASNSNINIGPLLKKYRKNCFLTQQQVAEALNINRTTYTYYESGKTEPSIETLHKLVKIFGITYDDIMPDLKTSQVRDFRFVPRGNEDIYALTKEEQKFVIKLRAMSPEDREKLMEYLGGKDNSTENESDSANGEKND